jgi:predicted nucleic-acid-binding protein
VARHGIDQGVDVVATVLRTKELTVERADVVWQALRGYRRSSKADFADCLIEHSAHGAECDYTVTFDR